MDIEYEGANTLILGLQKFDDLWDVLDEESTSFMDYGRFMRGFIGDMQEHRKAYVRKVRNSQVAPINYSMKSTVGSSRFPSIVRITTIGLMYCDP